MDPNTPHALARRADGVSAGVIGRLFSGKAETLRTILEQIQGQLAERTTLSETLQGVIAEEHHRLRDELLWLESFPCSWDRSLDGRRFELHRRREALECESRQERIQRWQDASHLLRESRQWVRDYQTLRQRMQLITPYEQTEKRQRN